MKFSELISDVILIVQQNFAKLACPEVAFPKGRLFEPFGLMYVVPPYGTMTSGKNFMVINPAAPEILWRFLPPRCQ